MRIMKIFTAEQLKQLPTIDEDLADEDNSKAYVKLFTPDSNWYWYVAAYDPENDMAYGVVKGQCVEYGYFSIAELRALRGPMGLPIERDLYFDKKPLKDVMEALSAGKYV